MPHDWTWNSKIHGWNSADTTKSKWTRMTPLRYPSLLSFGVFCYLVMAFGLKNTGATYQRLVKKIFKDLIGKMMEVYVDDMLVKSPYKIDHISHLQEAFEVLWHHKMMLNPDQVCLRGRLRTHSLASWYRSEAYKLTPIKSEWFSTWKHPPSIKDVQKLTERLAALGRLISKSGEKSLHFFKTLKRPGIYMEWRKPKGL